MSTRWSQLFSALRRKAPLLTACIGASTLVVFHRALFTSEIFISRDIQRVYYPLKQYWAQRVLHGELPQWYPYDGLGQPFIGMVISGTFHPLNVLYLLLPLELALKVNVLVCYPIAFLGVYLFARRYRCGFGAAVLAGLLFSFNGYMLCITNNLLYLVAAATFPWAFWAADRFFEGPTLRRATCAAGLTTLVLLAGDAQSFAICAAGVVVIGLLRHQKGGWLPEAARIGGVLALTLLFSSVQLLPTLALVGQAISSRQPLENALLWSLHPLRLLEMIWGPIFGGQTATDLSFAIDSNLLKTGMTTLWVESIHLGLPAFVLALTGWAACPNRYRVRIASICVALLILLALGKYVGLYTLFFKLFWFWRAFRYPEKFLPYLYFAISIAAALGAQRILEDVRVRSGAALGMALAAALSAGLWAAERGGWLFSRHLVASLWQGLAPEEVMIRLHHTFLTATLQSSVVSSLACAAIIWVLHGPTRTGLLAAFVFVDLALANEPLIELTFPNLLHTPTAFVTAILRREGSARLGGDRVYAAVEAHEISITPHLPIPDQYVISVATALFPDTPAMWGLESAEAYLPAASLRMHRLADAGLSYLGFNGNFNVRYTAINRKLFERQGLDPDWVIAEHPRFHLLLLRNPNTEARVALKRAYCVPNAEAAMAEIVKGKLNFATDAVVECAEGVPTIASSHNVEGTANLVSYQHERIDIQTDAPAEALLVLNDAFYSGWSATIDGNETRILPVNHAVRGVSLPGGKHRVVFTYRTPGLGWGALITFSSLAACLLYALFARRISAEGYQKTSQLRTPD